MVVRRLINKGIQFSNQKNKFRIVKGGVQIKNNLDCQREEKIRMMGTMIKMRQKFMINQVFLEINLNTILKLKKQMKKIFYLKSPRSSKERHRQNIGINLKWMNMKLFRIFLKKIFYFFKSKEVNHKFLQIQFRLRWNQGFQEDKKHRKNIKKSLYLHMTMPLKKIQKVQATSR